MNATLRNLMS